MAYNPATAAEILGNLEERFLTAEGQELGEDVVLRLAREGVLKVVDNLDLRFSEDAYSQARLAREGITDAAEWTVLAVVDRDETYFCDVDHKWEYCYTDYAVIAPADLVRREMEAAKFPESWDMAAKAGFPEYAN